MLGYSLGGHGEIYKPSGRVPHLAPDGLLLPGTLHYGGPIMAEMCEDHFALLPLLGNGGIRGIIRTLTGFDEKLSSTYQTSV